MIDETRQASSAGFTLLELVITGSVLPILVFAALSLVQSGQNLETEVRGQAVIMEKLRNTTRRVADELRVSSRTGEDSNSNGVLDDGEDRNGNSRLESDWSVGASSVQFNRMQSDGTYSLPVTYRLDGTTLMRDFEVTAGDMRTATIATGISAFSVTTPTDETVVIALTAEITRAGGEARSETASMTIHQRN